VSGADNYRFGPFFLDRAGYRLLRGDTAVDLTPKLLDLLLYLLDHAGTLVTKEQLLDALWPDVHVTDNALAQAVSELRQALGDDAGKPRFIKTVARRGYRFVGPVEPVSDLGPRPRPPFLPAETPVPGGDAGSWRGGRSLAGTEVAVAVLDFTNLSGDPDAAWLSAGIAETVSADLLALGSFRVVDRWRVMEAVRRTNSTAHEVAAALGVPLAVVGSFQTHGDQIRITARIVDVEKGEALADAKVDGPLESIFELQDSVVVQLSQELGYATSPRAGVTPRETPSLAAYRAFTEGWLQLETLDVREIPRSIANFERAIAADKRYALAYTGLASAQLAAYEATRAENEPERALLERAISNARRAVALDDTLAEAHATLALILVSAWDTSEAIRSARRAVALEPGNWRHFFRLGHASWGEERLRAAANTLALYPDFAFAHFQRAMVHVARGHLAEAETLLRQGAAVQDRQIDRGERYPALGLHWLLGLVRLAQDDPDEALREFDHERELAQPHRLYGREYEMNALHAKGACLVRLGRAEEAAATFRRALAVYANHAPTLIALMAFDRTLRQKVLAIVETLSSHRPVEAAIVWAQLHGAEGRPREAAQALSDMLQTAPAGFAGWTIPVDPLLAQLAGTKEFQRILTLLARRAA
jgi:DNA-binding winged helix-turn-helix (wHTH) protein/TolB-like protein/Tfp pilus assembly protein PilF